jgi:phage-related holin
MFCITCLYALVYFVIVVEKIKMLNLACKLKLEFPKRKCKDLIHEKKHKKKNKKQ